MKKIWRKTLLSGLAVSAAGSALALASCGGVAKFDTDEDKELQFALTITNTKVKETLDAIIDAYNEEHKAASGFTWKRREIKGGYDGTSEILNKNLPVKNKKGLFNVTLNYPSVLAIAKKYDMALPIRKTAEEIELKDKDGKTQKVQGSAFDLSTIIDEKFLKINDNIVGFEKGSQWTIPVNKSTEMLSINMPMFAYVLKKGEADGMVVQGKDSGESKKLYDKIMANGANDEDFVSQVLGTYVSSTDALKGFQFSFDIFKYYDQLNDFITRVGKAFPDFNNPDLESKKANTKLLGKNLLGIDSIANSMYAAAFASVGADYEKFLLNLTKNRSELDYQKLLKDPKSDEYKTLQNIYESFARVLKQKQLFVKNKSTYSSNYQKFHQMLMSIGSTAGYKHNSVSDSDYIYSVTKANNKVLPNITQNNAGEIVRPKESDKRNYEKIKKADSKAADYETIKNNTDFANDVIAVSVSGRNRNPIFKSTFKVPEGYEFPRYAFLSKDADMDNKLKTLVAGATSDTEIVAFISNSYDLKGEPVMGYQDGITDDEAKTFFFFEKNKYSKEKIDSTKSLQRSELLTLHAPVKNKPEDTKNVAILQGPSLFALHSNAEENEETQKFIKWFMTVSRNWEPKDDPTKSAEENAKNKKDNTFVGTAAEYFAKVGGYIIPTKENLGKVPTDAEMKQMNDGFKIARSNMDQMNKGELEAMEDPVESRSDEFRDQLEAAMLLMYNRTNQKSQSNLEFTDFLSVLNENLKKVLG